LFSVVNFIFYVFHVPTIFPCLEKGTCFFPSVMPPTEYASDFPFPSSFSLRHVLPFDSFLPPFSGRRDSGRNQDPTNLSFQKPMIFFFSPAHNVGKYWVDRGLLGFPLPLVFFVGFVKNFSSLVGVLASA